jgi:hypothetical protein
MATDTFPLKAPATPPSGEELGQLWCEYLVGRAVPLAFDCAVLPAGNCRRDHLSWLASPLRARSTGQR